MLCIYLRKDFSSLSVVSALLILNYVKPKGVKRIQMIKGLKVLSRAASKKNSKLSGSVFDNVPF